VVVIEHQKKQKKRSQIRGTAKTFMMDEDSEIHPIIEKDPEPYPLRFKNVQDYCKKYPDDPGDQKINSEDVVVEQNLFV
jgi:hypothetical protein